MPDIIEAALSARAKCRGCGAAIEKGALRFGEREPNPFAEGEGEVTYWFHLRCAALRRPERYAALTPELLESVADKGLLASALLGVQHHRLARIAGLEHAKSGRAKCRHCKESIDAGVLRFVLTIWQEGRFEPMGFVHGKCARDYFGTPELWPWLGLARPELGEADRAELATLLVDSETLDKSDPGQ